MGHTPYMGSPAHLAEIAIAEMNIAFQALATSPPVPRMLREHWAEFLGSFGIPYASNYVDAFLINRVIIHRYDYP